jgi:hypothetical protein
MLTSDRLEVGKINASKFRKKFAFSDFYAGEGPIWAQLAGNRDKVESRLSDTLSMFVGFGTISGRAAAVGQTNDRSSFQLVSGSKISYVPSQFRATPEEFGRTQRDEKFEIWSEQAKQN